MTHEPLHALPVVDCTRAAARQVLLRVSVAGSALAGAHTVPGQYVKLAFTADEGEELVPRPYAISSPPGTDVIELLLKVPEPRVDELLALGPDDRVHVSKPLGKGFPVEKASGHALWLFAVGSGIGPLRSVVEHLLPRHRAGDAITLLYGVRDVGELAFTSKLGAWAGRGVAVLPVVSRPEPGAWQGRTGHIQDHLPAAFDDATKVIAFVCGLPAMERDVSAALLARGVGPERVFRNW